jgi:hypothetical protein
MGVVLADGTPQESQGRMDGAAQALHLASLIRGQGVPSPAWFSGHYHVLESQDRRGHESIDRRIEFLFRRKEIELPHRYHRFESVIIDRYRAQFAVSRRIVVVCIHALFPKKRRVRVEQSQPFVHVVLSHCVVTARIIGTAKEHLPGGPVVTFHHVAVAVVTVATNAILIVA